MQITFSKKDGTLYVHFPYYAHSQGIASLVTWIPDNPPPANLSLIEGGKVTSHLVKYSHHPDGRAHFSQDGKVYTSIKKQSLPINMIDGHVFSVQIQGLSSYDQLDPTEFNLNWYSNCGHQEKRDKMNELLEVTHDQREKEVYPRV